MTAAWPGRLLNTGRSTAARAIRSGPRTVVLTADRGPRLGNVLYFWLHAYRESRPGRPWVVRVPSHLTPWLDLLPGLRPLSVDAPALRDRRVWPDSRLWQRYGIDFTRAELNAFIESTILTTDLIAAAAPNRPGQVVVNVRRGDYYSHPEFRALYGHDIHGLITEGLRRCAARAPIDSIDIVSDDPEWCRDHLAAIGNPYGAEVTVADQATPEEHFARLATANRLIGTNSTFSYWAAYVLTARRGAEGHVVMPRFHARHVDDGFADQLDPSWDIVESLPGGWAEPG